MELEVSRWDLLDMLGSYIRELYITRRRMSNSGCIGFSHYVPSPKWDGGKDTEGNKHKAIWPIIARYMLDNRLDPAACIELRFMYAHGRLVPAPNQVISPRFLDAYTEASRKDVNELRYSLQTQKQICKGEIYEAAEFDLRGEDAWSYVLLNDDVNLSPLFRVCVALPENLVAVIGDHLKLAVLQYIVDMDAYDKAWNGCIPAEFRTQVRDAFEQTVTKRTFDANRQKKTQHRRRKTTTDR